MRPPRPCYKDEVYGRWTVLEDSIPMNSKHMALCKCICGTVRVVLAISLLGGKSVSCGCYQKEKASTLAENTSLVHGCSRAGKRTRAYYVWKGMKTRCFNSKSDRYPAYGGRGITVCPDWKDSFANFLADMGEPPKGKSLDRVDNNGDYSKENCRWATLKEQQNNRRSNRLIEFEGETLNMSQWAEKVGISVGALHRRLKLGWTTQKALTQELRK